MLLKHRLVTFLATLSLALAIAGNTTVFSLVSAFVFHTWPYEDPERLVVILQTSTYQTIDPTLVSPANFVDWRERSRSFDELAAMQLRRFSLTGGDEPEPVSGVEVTANMFDLLGGEAAVGRTFLPEEDQPGRNEVAVVSYQFWRDRFGSDPSLVGRTISLDRTPYRVVGVMPEDFELPGGSAQVFVPLTLTLGELPRDIGSLVVFGRLKPDTSPDEAKAEIAAIAQNLEREYPDANRGYGARVQTLREWSTDNPGAAVMYLLQGALFFVLLIACANLANLLLARGQDRQHEIALRVALGAPRRRIVRQLLTESLALALCGGAAGCLLAVWGVQLLAAFFGGQAGESSAPKMDGLVLGFTLAISGLTGLACGLAPALQASKPSLTGELREGARGVTIGSRRRLLARGLVVAEVGVALVMLSGAGLLIRGFRSIQDVDPGFEGDNLLTVRLVSPEVRSTDGQARADLTQRLRERVEALPGVIAAAATNVLPLSFLTPKALFTIDARQRPNDEQRLNTTVLSVSPGYLRTMGVPLMRGRAFTFGDRADSLLVALIGDGARRLYWPDENPVGQRITVRGQSREIVGVIGNIQHDMLLEPQDQPVVYLPEAQAPDARSVILVVHTRPDPHTLIAAVRAAVREVDPDATTVQARTMNEVLTERLVFPRLVSGLLVGFGLLAMILAAIGIYGVIAFSVSRRTHEIGVRMAMGARRRDVLALVIREGLLLTAIGFGVGLPGMFLVSRAISSTFLGLSPVASGTTLLVGLALFVVAVAASYIPARRAASLDPMLALRYE